MEYMKSVLHNESIVKTEIDRCIFTYSFTRQCLVESWSILQKVFESIKKHNKRYTTDICYDIAAIHDHFQNIQCMSGVDAFTEQPIRMLGIRENGIDDQAYIKSRGHWDHEYLDMFLLTGTVEDDGYIVRLYRIER